MTESAARQPVHDRLATDASVLELARQVLCHEAAAIEQIAARLDDSLVEAVTRIEACRGCVVVTGMGKAGLIGQKIAATFSSTGTPSHFLHPAEALHGDLGVVRPEDLLLALSMSGRTEELLRVVGTLKGSRHPVISITGSRTSPLARMSDVVLTLGELREAGHLGLAPTTSTTAMLALGDALALSVSQRRGFGAVDFARCHPAGALGRRLARVEEVMRPLDQCRAAPATAVVRDVLVHLGRPGRRTGAIMLLDEQGRLSGIFTDSDLARLLERKQDAAIDGPMTEVMTRQPTSVRVGAPAMVAVEMLAHRKLSELPVLDDEGRPVGLIDVTDLLDLWEHSMGGDRATAEPASPAPRPELRIVTPVDGEE